tara:strand:- start:946 stop:1194 length:249 start_codon:yes stop_codon:yes gene_type:complete
LIKRICNVIHWGGFIFSIFCLYLIADGTYNSFQSPYRDDNDNYYLVIFFMGFFFSPIPTLVGAVINYILTGRKNILPWRNDE